MRKIRDVLRLSVNGLSKRKIAASLGLSTTAAGDCIRRAPEAGVAWPLAAELTDAALERLLYRSADWATVHRELKRAGVTLQLLWEEYRAAHPDDHGYALICRAAARTPETQNTLRPRSHIPVFDSATPD
jgi:transposase